MSVLTVLRGRSGGFLSSFLHMYLASRLTITQPVTDIFGPTSQNWQVELFKLMEKCNEI
jgi:hypothetical protein